MHIKKHCKSHYKDQHGSMCTVLHMKVSLRNGFFFASFFLNHLFVNQISIFRTETPLSKEAHFIKGV